MHDRLQFGMRENPASDGRHGSRKLVRGPFDQNCLKEEKTTASAPTPGRGHLIGNTDGNQSAAPRHAVTAGGQEATVTPPTVATPGSRAHRMPDFEPLIGSCEAACLLGNIHVKTLQRYARHQRIPGYQIGGHWYFRASELDSWLRSQINSNRQPADRVDLAQEEIP